MPSQEQRQEAARLLAEHRAWIKGTRSMSRLIGAAANAFMPGLGIMVTIGNRAGAAMWKTYESDLEAIIRGERDAPARPPENECRRGSWGR